MKTLMIIFLIGFLVFGAIGLYFRLTHDWNKLAAETDKLDENSTAKRDGRAMQLGKGLDIDIEKAEKKADQKFRRQLTFSVLAVICLAAAIVCGALMQR